MRPLFVFSVVATFVLSAPTFVAAQSGSTAAAAPSAVGTISGTVVDGNGKPVGGAQISVEGGPGSEQVRSAADGTFTIAKITPGTYTVIVSRGGFETTRQTGVLVFGGTPVVVRVTLALSSFSSLRTIGSTSTSARGRLQINTSPAAVAVISNESFQDQGAVQIQNILNETPGIITTHLEQNGASQGTEQVTMIRGGLAYETESLIDGHPISIGATGVYNPILINPAVLQDVEVVKGPGSFATEINSAINGTVNYRTLEPTSKPHESLSFGSDQYGGVSTTLRATGSIPGNLVDYAFAVATDGTNGPLFNFPAASSTTTFDYLGASPYTIAGKQIAAPTTIFVPSSNPQYIGYPGEIKLSQPLYFCCSNLNTGFHQDSELGKLRFKFSQQTALTLSFLGGQAIYDANSPSLAAFQGGGIAFFNFLPPAGYTGSIPSGTQAVFDDNAGLQETTHSQTGLYQAQLSSALGAFTLLGRLYSSYERDYSTSPGYASQTLHAWGGVPLCPVGDTATAAGGCNLPGGAAGPAPSLTFFNGQLETITGTGGDPFYELNTDHGHGYSFEVDRPIGPHTVSVSFDQSNHDSTEYLDEALVGLNNYQLAPGSGQQFTTISAHADLAVAKNVSATVGEYLINYASHFSGDSGATFSDASHHYDTPRLAIQARPNADTSVRFSTGGSIAPPYISLLSAPAEPPQPNIPAAPNYYTENVNNGQISPETAWGYDLGIDHRIARRLTVSGDLYLTTLHNSFLSETYQDGTYTATSGAAIGQTEPLYITKTANLGQSRYEGIEAQIVDDPLAGFGFRVQGSLMRAFAYDVPNSLYATSSGPYTTNLAVVPNVNYQPSGIGFNGVEDVNSGSGRVPYSQGYAEVNYKTIHGVLLNLGVTYYGNNNSYNNPAFGVVSSSFRYPLGRAGSLQISGFNLTNAYAQPYFNFFGGIPVPLVNGSHGAKTGNLGTIESGNVGPTTFRLIYSLSVGR